MGISILALGLIFPQIAGATIYQPGETLEPNCAPGSANCGVATLSINSQTIFPQTFITGISGTDFNIISGAGVHTFNIPDASAIARGLLKASDWSIFNAKQTALGFTPVSTTTTINSQALTGNITLSTADILDSLNKRYITDAQLTLLGNTSGTNTGNVTIGTGNGLSLLGQTLSAALSSASTTGTLSSLDWNTFNAKQATLGFTPLNPANNLSDLASALTARTNLGLGTLATQSGTFSGISSGTNTGDQTTISGNAGTASALQTARTINGVSFDGFTNIIVPAAAGTLTGITLSSNVVSSSLTSVGALSSLVLSGAVTGATGYNGLVITANTGSITTGIWNGTTIAIANGGTGTTNGSITGTGALSFTSNAANALTLDSGTTGAINIGIGANAKAVTIGSTTVGTTLALTGGASWSVSTAGAATFGGLVTASNGLTLTTGALNLTATSGALTLSGLSASSISTGANALTITSSNVNTTATGINSTAIGATTPSTGAFTTLSSTGTSNIGQGSGVVTVNSSGALNLTGASASTWTLANVTNSLNFDANTLSIDALNNRVGIGTSTPGFGLSVVGNTSNGNIANITNLNTTSATTNSVLRLSTGTVGPDSTTRLAQFYSGATTDSNGTGVGNIRLNGSGVSYASGNADLAEWTDVAESVAAGDIIASLSTGNKKAVAENLLLGVVSDAAAFIGNETEDLTGKAVVGFLGRINTKVSTENGNIAIGDPIAVSSVAGVGMKQTKAGPTIGNALAAYSGVGVSRIAVQVVPGWFDPDPLLSSVLIGDISPKVNADGTDNGLATLVATIQSETSHNPVAIIAKKIADGKQFLTDFIAARVSAIRGYFDEVFAKKVHTEKICVKKSDDNEVCVNGDQLNSLLQNANTAPAPTPPSSNIQAFNDNPHPTSSSTPAVVIESILPPSPDASTFAQVITPQPPPLAVEQLSASSTSTGAPQK